MGKMVPSSTNERNNVLNTVSILGILNTESIFKMSNKSEERLKSKYQQFVDAVGFHDWCEYGKYLIWREHAKACGYRYDDFDECGAYGYGAQHKKAYNYDARYKKWKHNAPNDDDFRHWCEWIQWLTKKQNYDNGGKYTCPHCHGKGYLRNK